MTGLTPSEVESEDLCQTAIGPEKIHCDAQILVLRSNHQAVQFRPEAQQTFTQRTSSGPNAASPASSSTAAQTPPLSYSPAWLQQAYDLSYLSQTAGSGDTVAVIEYGDDPTAESDLAYWRSHWGLPACTTANGCFRKVNAEGQASPLPPTGPNDWVAEESLDEDAVSALCPNCHIIMIEVGLSADGGFDGAQAQAVAMGANQISNSWSGDGTTLPTDSSAYSYPGVAVIASTGDNGYIGNGENAYPASFPGVTAAGGTSIVPGDPSPRGFTETAWSINDPLVGQGGGSGCNTLEAKPSYQTDVGCTGRSYADVSADANPYSGLLVYDGGEWIQSGGTSLASPLIAAYEAVTGINGASPQWAYNDSSLLNDPITGSVGTCPPAIAYICNAGPGYDGPTGIGSISGDVATGAPGIGGPSGLPFSPYANTYTASVTSATVTLGAGIYPNGLDTSYYWQYGTSSAYGQQTPTVDIGSGKAAAMAGATITGLTAGGTYDYRLVAVNADGTTYGYSYSAQTPSSGSNSIPSASSPPTISGSAYVNQTLSLKSVGTWNGAPLSYGAQWLISTDGCHTYSALGGATTGQLTLASAEVGDCFEVTMTAANSYGSGTSTSAPIGPVLAATALQNTTAPSISGTLAKGNILSAGHGAWSPAATSYAYQWQESGNGTGGWSTVGSATTYALTSANVGEYLQLQVTATAPSGQGTATSSVVGPIGSGGPMNAAAPQITGTAQQGQTLKASTGTWNPAAKSYAYQWQSSSDGQAWSSISGATKSSYTSAAADVGKYLRVQVTATNKIGQTIATSAATSAVASGAPVNTVLPKISGTTRQGQLLKVTKGTWSPAAKSYAYQWQSSPDNSNWSAITGASGSSYTPTAADVSDYLRVHVTAINTYGQTTAASAATSTEIASGAPANTAAPKLSGTTMQGKTLKATAGTWSPAGKTYTYQWQEFPGGAGSSWSAISGATKATYTLQAADVGLEVRIQVTATNPYGSSLAAYSAATTAVLSGAPQNTKTPTISGTAAVGKTLTAKAGTWSPSGTYSYQWQSSPSSAGTWTNILGATSARYTVQTSDSGNILRVQVTANNTYGQAIATSTQGASAQLTLAKTGNIGAIKALALSGRIVIINNK